MFTDIANPLVVLVFVQQNSLIRLVWVCNVYINVSQVQVFFLQKYQRNMTLRNEAEEGDDEGKKADAPEPVRRGGRKRRHEEVCLSFIHLLVYVSVLSSMMTIAWREVTFMLIPPCTVDITVNFMWRLRR